MKKRKTYQRNWNKKEISELIKLHQHHSIGEISKIMHIAKIDVCNMTQFLKINRRKGAPVKKLFNDIDIQQIKSCIKQGLRRQDIALKFGFTSVSGFRYRLNQENIVIQRTRPGRQPVLDDCKIKNMYLHENFTIAEIAKKS